MRDPIEIVITEIESAADLPTNWGSLYVTARFFSNVYFHRAGAFMTSRLLEMNFKEQVLDDFMAKEAKPENIDLNAQMIAFYRRNLQIAAAARDIQRGAEIAVMENWDWQGNADKDQNLLHSNIKEAGRVGLLTGHFLEYAQYATELVYRRKTDAGNYSAKQMDMQEVLTDNIQDVYTYISKEKTRTPKEATVINIVRQEIPLSGSNTLKVLSQNYKLFKLGLQ